MVTFRGLSISVLVDGQPLTEYPDEEANDQRLSSTNQYIESQVGKEFSFQITWDTSIFEDCVAIDVQIDEESSSVDEPADLKKHMEKLGLLSVQVLRDRTKTRLQDQTRKGPQGLDFKRVTEKAFKGQAIDTKATLGTSRPCRPANISACSYIETRDDPFITFNWKYRSQKALQITGIIPRTPTPEPLEDRSIETLSREELIELFKRRGANIPTQIKSEKNDVALSSIKREKDEEFDEILASAREVKRVRTEKVEVVDVADD